MAWLNTVVRWIHFVNIAHPAPLQAFKGKLTCVCYQKSWITCLFSLPSAINIFISWTTLTLTLTLSFQISWITFACLLLSAISISISWTTPTLTLSLTLTLGRRGENLSACNLKYQWIWRHWIRLKWDQFSNRPVYPLCNNN